MRHLNSVIDLSRSDIDEIFALAESLKARSQRGERPQLLAGRVLTQLFEKPSLRTRVSFEAAMMQLGGSSIFLSAKDAGLGGREAVQDVARVLGGYSDVIAMRTFSQKLIDDFIKHASCPIINGLSDDRHPCQALTDLFTMREAFGDVSGRKFVFVGDGNNVARSLAILGALAGVEVVVASPQGYSLEPVAGATLIGDPVEAVETANAIYADVWVSMGDEETAAERRAALGPYRVDDALLDRAAEGAIALHCLPAHPGEEITPEVLYGPRQRIWDQAENRRHAQKALLELLCAD